MSDDHASAAITCTCPDGPRCPEGNALWEAANAVYYSRGHDAWEEALNDYREHVQLARDDSDVAEALGGKVGGHVTPGPDGSLYEWWCTNCSVDGEEPTEQAAGLALYEHRQRVHSGRNRA